MDSDEEIKDPSLGPDSETATEPPIMVCETCEVIQHPESSTKQPGCPYPISFYMLEEATRKGCHFCRIILTGFNFFKNVHDQSDKSKPGLVLDAVQATSQRDYGGLALRALSWSHCALSGLEDQQYPFIDVEFCTSEEHSSPWPVFKNSGYVCPRLDLDTTLKLIRNSIGKCDDCGHTYCPDFGTLSSLPSRVLDVSPGQDGDGISLVETRRELATFMTLSHCWGKVKFIQTTAATLAERKKNIPLAQLPQTFKDAVSITPGLGVQYLWIDSLCIIQDDLLDWEIESSRMANVFSNSWLNLAVTYAADSSVSCFGDRTCRQYHGTWKLETHTIPETEALHPQIHVRPILGQLHSELRNPEKMWAYKVKLSPLFTRGWIYQERVLSPRTVYIGSSEVVWDCLSCRSCECGELNHYKRTSAMDVRETLFWRRPANNERYWATVVYVYSGLDITNQEDRLPALSGVASRIAEQFGSDYLAGLWKRFLPQELLWTAHHTVNNPEHRYVRARPYRAPTWSWASLDVIRDSDQKVEFGGGSIVFQTIWLPGRRYKYLEADSPEFKLDHRFHIEDVCCEVLGQNMYGRVSAGEIVIRAAYAIPIQINWYPGRLECNYYLKFEGYPDSEVAPGELTRGMLQSDLESSADCPDEKDIRCILIYQTKQRTEFGDTCLVLKLSRETPGKYERMGVMDCPKDVDFFIDAKEDTFYII